MAAFTESFNTTDNSWLGPDLTWSDLAGDFRVISGAADVNPTVTRCLARAEHSTGSDNMYAEMTIPVGGLVNANYADVCVCVRMSADGLTDYNLRRGYATTGGAFWEVRKTVAGTSTVIVTRTSLAFSFPETWRLEADGSTLRVYLNGSQVGTSITDTSIATGSYGGISGYLSNLNDGKLGRIDSFGTGSLTTSQTIALGQAVETDTAQVVTKAGAAITLGQAVETDTAQPLGKIDPILLPLGQAVETDTAQAITGPDTFSTDFPGTALPSGWAFHSALGDGSVSVADGWATLTLPAGVVHDGISSNMSSVDNTVGLKANLPAHGGDVDVAVYLGTDLTDQLGLSVNVYAFGADPTAELVRFSIYHSSSDADIEYPWVYGVGRSGGTAANFLNNTYDKYMTGCPAWLRLKYTSSSGLWQFYTSSDGVEWTLDRSRDTGAQDVTGTRSFTPASFKVSIGSSGSSPPGATFRVGKALDLIARGNTDLRDPAPTMTSYPVSSFTGTAGALPTGWEDASVGAGNISWTGTALRLHDDGAVEGNRAAIRYTGTSHLGWGVLLKLVNGPTGSTDYYLTAGLVRTDVTDTGDQYVDGAGYGLEVQQRGQIRRPIRIDRYSDTTLNPVAPFPTDLNETRYCHLKDWRSEYNLNLGGTRWFRVERAGSRLRMKEWADGTAEPSTWNLFDGQDEVEVGPSRPFISLSHNGTRPGTNDLDLLHVEFYELSAAQRITLGQAVETDTAQPVARAKTVALGQAAETDTATVLGKAQALPLGQAAETDIAQPMSSPSTTIVLLGQAVEVFDTASIPAVKSRTLGQPVETDTAQPITRPAVTLIPLGQAMETDAPSALGKAKVRALAQAASTESALTLAALGPRTITLGQAAETDTAWAIAVPSEVVLLRGASTLATAPSATSTVTDSSTGTSVVASPSTGTSTVSATPTGTTNTPDNPTGTSTLYSG